MCVVLRMKKFVKNVGGGTHISNSFDYSTARLLMNALKMQEKYSCLANSIGKISYPNLPSYFNSRSTIFWTLGWKWHLFAPSLINYLFRMQVYQITRETTETSRARYSQLWGPYHFKCSGQWYFSLLNICKAHLGIFSWCFYGFQAHMVD